MSASCNNHDAYDGTLYCVGKIMLRKSDDVIRTLVELRNTGSAVLVIPGNHDNARRFAAIEGLSGAAGIVIVPAVRRPDAGGIVEFSSRDGTQVAQVAALPWVPEKRLFGAGEMMGLEGDPSNAYADELAKLVNAVCAFSTIRRAYFGASTGGTNLASASRLTVDTNRDGGTAR